MSAQPEPKEVVYCYVGKRPCGCLVAAAVDKPEYTKDTAKSVAKWMRDGLTIERQTVEYVRANFATCPHKDKKPKQEDLFT
jgi:hypothetical protein